MSLACLPSTAARPPRTQRALYRVREAMRDIWVGPVIALGSVMCGGLFTLLTHLLGHGAP